VQNKTKKQKKQTKRTQYMCAKMLRWIRKDMKYEPRDMCDQFELPRRTYQDYEAGKRGIPAKLALLIREQHKHDREWINGIGDRVDAAERGKKG
jgi:hypothetical protein